MATYKFLIEVKFDKVPEDVEEDVLQSIEDEIDQANPGNVYYENERGDEKTREIKEWNISRHYDELEAN
jgi:hypothetical protein